MKLTKQKLREIIAEELNSLQEYDEGNIAPATDDTADRNSLDAIWMQVRTPGKSTLAAPEKMATPGAQSMAKERIGNFALMMLDLNLSPEDDTVWRAVKDAIDNSSDLIPVVDKI